MARKIARLGHYVSGKVARSKLHQRGRTHLHADSLRKAKPVGVRKVSSGKNKGKEYSEKRANRSDKGFSKKLGWL